MTNEISTTKNFQEKMFERIREQMGDLMTEDDLKALVDSAMKKAFFEPAYEKDLYGNLRITKDSVFINLIRKEMEIKVSEAIKTWLVEHPEEVSKAIDETIAKGMFSLIQQHIEKITMQPMLQFADQLRAKGLINY
jgi:hypothetical protein